MADWVTIVLALLSALGGTSGIVALLKARTIAQKTVAECWRELTETYQKRLSEVESQLVRVENELRQERAWALRRDGKIQELELQRVQWERERTALLEQIEELTCRIKELEGKGK